MLLFYFGHLNTLDPLYFFLKRFEKRRAEIKAFNIDFVRKLRRKKRKLVNDIINEEADKEANPQLHDENYRPKYKNTFF